MAQEKVTLQIPTIFLSIKESPLFATNHVIQTPSLFVLSIQRWAAMSSPRESWGPALQKYRQVAWDTHVQHGTTMGGKLEGGLEDNHHAAADPAVEPAVMYKAQANDGYDPPV